MRKRMATPIIIDGRNLLRPEDARAADFEYISVGRSAVNALH